MPWVRDPAFYKTIWMSRSDVPAHEGPTHHGVLEVWTYTFPLSKSAAATFLEGLRVIPAINEQAKMNLTGNARDLWVAGIRDIINQVADLKKIKTFEGVAKDRKIMKAIDVAISSTEDLATWLTDAASEKTGPSGIGKDNYTWYQKHVHLVPISWEEEVMLLKRELTRAWSALKMEEHKNRKLPPMPDADSPEAIPHWPKRQEKVYWLFWKKRRS